MADVKDANEETGVDIATLQEHKVIVAEEKPKGVRSGGTTTIVPLGGDAALMEYLNNISYPAIARENSIQGKVTCSFVVGKDGSIQDVRVERSVDTQVSDKEAVE